MGIVVKAYSINDPNNYSKLCTEYDVTVLEQNENISITNITYRNCISSQSFGSIADFFEANLRYQTVANGNGAINTAGQNGPIVLIQCLDAYTNKAIIVGSLIHPDRKTTITSTEPQLQGEYNGVNVAVSTTGAATLTFNGATDTNGKAINSSQNATVAQIQDDGSVVIVDAAGTMLSTNSSGSLQAITSNGNLVFLNNETNEISVTQKDGNTIGINSTGITVSDSTGKQIVTVNGSTIQLTSGGTVVEQSSAHTINSSSVNINGAAGVKIKDQLGGELNIANGKVALGAPTAELLDLFSQTLSQMNALISALNTAFVTPATPFSPLDPAWTASSAPITAQLAVISGLLSSIKGTL